ncbi:hypothetical protein ONS95_004004 [Cadophora gregata]|uniref:uncharacterized protein n=1 Tax=Cadophora gregata TaxID=51156 RepID=UPI0026DA8984|nr:uncharacterized protein ONS95_004004 [Cadophora gregata]KAK0107308.1 hypothetical protein ONS95_004004 [Cadophora gregata]KAK0116991.1 hypothetical protein ONS96_012832 [Cadophora gregata f. sp. sojae]
MVKTTTKRKSESALPAGTSKHRKTSARTEDASDSAVGESSDQLFVDQELVAPKHIKKSSMRTRKSEPVKRTSRSDEYEEDEGRMGSKQFLAMVEFYGENKKNIRAAKAASNYLGTLGSKVDEAEESIKNRLQVLGIEATNKDSDFTKAFQDAYAASRPLPHSASDGSQVMGQSKDVSFATLFERSQEIIQDAKLIVEKFDNARRKTSGIKTSQLTDNNWEDETMQATHILAIGHKIGLDKYETMLMGSSGPDIEEEDSVSANLIYPNTDGNVSVPWGGIAKKGEKTMRKLLKAIAMETV